MKPCTVDSVLLAALEQFEYTKLPIGSYLLRWRKLRGTTQKEDVKVAGNPVTLKVDKPGIQADRFLCLAKLLARNQFWESQTVHCP